MSLRLVDVELPEGERFEHHVLRPPVERVRELVRAGEITDGFSLTALLWAVEAGAIR